MKTIKVYTKDYCPYCDRAKNLLKNKGLAFEVIDVENDEKLFEELKAKTGLRTVPQIFVGDQLIGGFTDLKAMDDAGQFDPLVQED